MVRVRVRVRIRVRVSSASLLRCEAEVLGAEGVQRQLDGRHDVVGRGEDVDEVGRRQHVPVRVQVGIEVGVRGLGSGQVKGQGQG